MTTSSERHRPVKSNSGTLHGNRKHGATGTQEYRIWRGMRVRCVNSNARMFKRYGGRGIKICDRWLNSFENFLADMGKRPSSGHSLDRIDNDGPYSPENCRWATWVEQARNRSNTKRYEIDGLSLTLPEWAERSGFRRKTLQYRLNAGWSLKEAISVPLCVPRRAKPLPHLPTPHQHVPTLPLPANPGPRFSDLTGLDFGHLTVLGYAGSYKDGQSFWACRCICGDEIKIRTCNLKKHPDVSCGCVGREKVRQANRRHGGKGTTEHRIWKGMRTRCYNQHDKSYANYGGRGIVICDRWRSIEDGFKTFLADMGRRPSPQHSLDRIDNDGPYSPENCRWATTVEQARNRRGKVAG